MKNINDEHIEDFLLELIRLPNDDDESARENERQAKELDKFVKDISRAYKNHELIIFLGAGCSRKQGYPDWAGYVKLGIIYWISNLGNIQYNGKKINSSVKVDHINYLVNLMEDDKTPHKRKIDLLHSLIKNKYCNSPDIDSEILFKENKNNFEKSFFIDSEPVKPDNKIYEALCKLNSFVITTNYDNQYELTYEKIRGRKINIFNNIEELPEKQIPLNTILHLHGTPYYENYFINSTDAYEKLYYSDLINKLTDLINSKESPVILFIGCNLSEDEIMRIAKNGRLTCYGLMRNNYATADNIEKELYQTTKNTSIIRYGHKYDDLDRYVAAIVKHLTKQVDPISLQYNDYSDDYDLMDQMFDSMDYADLNEKFKGLSNLDFYKVKNLKLFTSNSIYDSVDFYEVWDKLLKEISDYDKGKEIIEMFKNIKRYNRKIQLLLLNYFQENLDWIKKQYKINEIFDSFYFIFKERFREDKEYLGYWFLYQINHSSLYSYYEKHSLVKIELDKVQTAYLAETLESISGYRRQNPLNHKALRLMHGLLKERNLVFDTSVKELFQNIVFQRIYVDFAIYKNSEELDPIILEEVKKSIDYGNQFFGKNLNDFVEKFKIQEVPEDMEYKDAFTMSKSGWIEGAPHIFADELLVISSDEFESKFIEDKFPLQSFDSFVEYDDREQIKEIQKVYKPDKEKYLLLCEKIIDKLDLFKRFYMSVLFSDLDLTDTEIKDIVIETLRKLSSENIINYEVAEFYKSQIDSLKEKASSILSKYSIDSFENHYFEEEKGNLSEIDLIYFLNTEIGTYFNLIFDIRADLNDENFVSNQLNFIDNSMLKSYLEGMFYQVGNNIVDVSKHTFAGFSHKYKINKGTFQMFKNAILDILGEGTEDEFLEINLLIAMFWFVEPLEKYSVDLFRKLAVDFFQSLEKLYSNSQTNSDSWSDFYLSKDDLQFSFVSIFYDRYAFLKDEFIIYFMKKLKELELCSSDEKLNAYEISYYLLVDEEISETSIRNYLELIKMLTDARWLIKDVTLLQSLEQLFDQLVNKGYERIVDEYVKQNPIIFGAAQDRFLEKYTFFD